MQIRLPKLADPIGSKRLLIFEAGEEVSYEMNSYELVEAVIMRNNHYH